jgi:hypothetical protein
LAGAGLVFLVSEAGVAMLAGAVPFLVFGVALFSIRDASYLSLSPSAGIDRLYRRPPYLIDEQVAAYLHAHARPDDTLYVAFYQADLYHLTGLRNPTPYLFRLDLDHIPGAFEDVTGTVARRTPTYVLDLKQPLASNLDTAMFYRALAAGYAPEQTFGGTAVLYHRKSSP